MQSFVFVVPGQCWSDLFSVARLTVLPSSVSELLIKEIVSAARCAYADRQFQLPCHIAQVSSRKIDDLLNEGHSRFSPLQRLLKQSANQKQWTAQLRALLDNSLRHEVEMTDIRGQTAYLLCNSAAAATRLRFLVPEILPKLQSLSGFSQVKELSIRVSNSRN